MYGSKAKKIQWKVAVAEGNFTMGGPKPEFSKCTFELKTQRPVIL